LPAVTVKSIDKNTLRDPAGLAFRSESAELFIGSRHGMTAVDGVKGSIARFLYDADSRSFTPNGEITGNGLNGVCQVAFSPVTGELFAANRAGGGVSRFTFDKSGQAIPNGTIGDADAAGVCVAPDGKRLYVTAASNVIQQFDLTTGQRLADVTLQGAGGVDLHFMAIFGSDLYAPGIASGLVYRLTVGSNDELTLKDTIPTDNPISVAFSPDGQEMFVAPHMISTLIDRFKYDAQSSTWIPTTKIDAGTSMGTLLTFAENARPIPK
jgi:DNA-binding beta-propeller fold protein YncE